MKLSIRFLRWVFLVLYILIVAALTMRGLFIDDSGARMWTIIYLGLMIVSQLIFLLGSGTIELCRPIKRRRLLFPVVVASMMMAILAGAFTMALTEFFDVHTGGWVPYTAWGVMILSWVFWCIIFFIHSRELERYQLMRNLTRKVLAGSLIEVLLSIPMHMVVSRRPGCFVGMYTAMGISAGIFVMLWAFGTGIVLLFLRDKRNTSLNG